MRVLRIGTEVLGVTGEVERTWQELESAARKRAALRGDSAPHIRIRTDMGVTGILPVTQDVPITFGDAEPGEAVPRGSILAADGGSEVPLSEQTPDQVSAEWPRP